MMKIKCIICNDIVYPRNSKNFCSCYNEASIEIVDGQLCVGANNLSDIRVFDIETQEFREVGI